MWTIALHRNHVGALRIQQQTMYGLQRLRRSRMTLGSPPQAAKRTPLDELNDPTRGALVNNGTAVTAVTTTPGTTSGSSSARSHARKISCTHRSTDLLEHIGTRAT